MREDTAAINGEKSAAVAGTGEEAAIGSLAEGVDDFFARSPKFFGRAFSADAVDAAREKRRKGDESLLRLRLSRADYAAGCDRGGSLWSRNNGAGNWDANALLFTDRGEVDGAVGRDRQRSDFAFGGFVENKTLGSRRSGIFRIFASTFCVFFMGMR